jgi:hypothetical protein
MTASLFDLTSIAQPARLITDAENTGRPVLRKLPQDVDDSTTIRFHVHTQAALATSYAG